MIVTPYETVPPLASTLVQAGRTGSARRTALTNGTAPRSVIPPMDRRAFIGALASDLLAAPLAAKTQQGSRTWRVGFLSGGGQPPDGASPLPLRQALQALGYVEQRNVIYLSRRANAKQDRLPGLAAELLGLKVDVIVTVGGPSSAAAKERRHRLRS